MSGVRSPTLPALLLTLSTWCLACGGGASGSPQSADSATNEASGPTSTTTGPKPKEGSLGALREKLKRPLEKDLDLAGQGLGPELGTVLGEASLDGVEKLDASDNDLGADGARGLLASTRLGSLSALDLGGNGIGDSGAQALGDSQLPKLTS